MKRIVSYLLLSLPVCGGLPAQDVNKAIRPGANATMQEFIPYSYTTNSTWVLTDARPNAGGQTYTVRYLADGRFWMVDDLKYPTACKNKTTFSGAESKGSPGAKVPGFYGDCTNVTNSDTPAARGYLYDWMFVMQHAEAYDGSSWNPGCINNPSAKAVCRGICPEGWHVPTGNESTGEFTLLNNIVNGGSTSSPSGLRDTSTFSTVYGGYAYSGSLYGQGSIANYWSSSYHSVNSAYHLYFYSSVVNPVTNSNKNYGYTLRCVRNY